MYDPTLAVVRSVMTVDRFDSLGADLSFRWFRDHDVVLARAGNWFDEPTICTAIVRHGMSAIRALNYELDELRADVRAAFKELHGTH